MWVLEAPTLLLHFFTSPEKVPGGYAILSHVWEGNEQTFQDVEQLRHFSLEERRERVSPKIRNFCDLADREGYLWVWIDTCCIDKTSSAELSEAINSMFRYYTLAHVCYVYLSDVPTPQDAPMTHGTFRKSRWHTRGWTLQELIAPRMVFFLSDSWKYIGSKAALAHRLYAITGIPASILRLARKPRDFCIAQRMSWAARRETTRPEDEAYCLLGIFDINMPTLYGEGRKAFRRLQEEIMKQSSDTTLFAWGYSSNFIPRTGLVDLSTLFATDPGNFRKSYDICYAPRVREQPRTTLDQSEGDYLVTFNITPHGVQAHLPIVRIQGQPCADLGWIDSKSHSRLLLRLDDYNEPYFNSTHPRYTVAALDIRDHTCPEAPRSILNTDLSPLNLSPPSLPWKVYTLHAVWQDVYLRDVSQVPSPVEMPIHIPINHTRIPPIRIPEHLIANIAAQLATEDTDVTAPEVMNGSLPWDGDPPMIIQLCATGQSRLGLVLGRCSKVIQWSAQAPLSPHGQCPSSLWANAQDWEDDSKYHRNTGRVTLGHQCPDDHILTWPGLERRFVVRRKWNSRGTITFTLGFALCSDTGTLTLRYLKATVRPDLDPVHTRAVVQGKPAGYIGYR
ncbi:heterokaryon incompatibility protein-domain-containing protein [Earliella scabrosa]|nr:heterokaryon incompatibility protein-domain-containing protein [Earliella scabrosa]